MTYQISKLAAGRWELRNVASNTRLGTYSTRAAAFTTARLLVGRSGSIMSIGVKP